MRRAPYSSSTSTSRVSAAAGACHAAAARSGGVLVEASGAGSWWRGPGRSPPELTRAASELLGRGLTAGGAFLCSAGSAAVFGGEWAPAASIGGSRGRLGRHERAGVGAGRRRSRLHVLAGLLSLRRCRPRRHGPSPCRAGSRATLVPCAAFAAASPALALASSDGGGSLAIAPTGGGTESKNSHYQLYGVLHDAPPSLCGSAAALVLRRRALRGDLADADVLGPQLVVRSRAQVSFNVAGAHCLVLTFFIPMGADVDVADEHRHHQDRRDRVDHVGRSACRRGCRPTRGSACRAPTRSRRLRRPAASTPNQNTTFSPALKKSDADHRAHR